MHKTDAHPSEVRSTWRDWMGHTARVAAVMLLASAFCADAAAQMFTYGADRPRAVQSLSFGYQIIDFNYSGDSTPNPSFEFSGPAYGLVYTRPNFTASVAYGGDTDSSQRDLRILNASILTWGEIHLTGANVGGSGLFVPIAIHTNYRRVAPRGSEDSIVDAFNVTVLGLGAGLGYSAQAGKILFIEARVTPVIGLALRAFGDSAGSSRLLDADFRVHLVELAAGFGLSAGYGYRSQVWNVGSSDLLEEIQGDLFDYAGSQHVISVGVNW